MSRSAILASALFMAVTTSSSCKKEEPAPPPPPPAIELDRGVDLATKTVFIGALNDESGPAAAIGKPFAAGKRLLARQVNAGHSGILPDGWKVELVERDCAYDPDAAAKAYAELRDKVLFIGTSFGTHVTLSLVDQLKADGMVAFPASLSSELAQIEDTPPLGAPYRSEAMRAMDWAVEKAGGAGKVKAAIVYQGDQYGKDGLDGWTQEAAHHGVKIVERQAVDPSQQDYVKLVAALQKSGANYVLLTVIPSATGPILTAAERARYAPTWLGQTPSWTDAYFDSKFVPASAFASYYWVTGMPYWGEQLAGMGPFEEVYDKFGGKELSPKDFYLLDSYATGRVQLEALKRAIEAGDVTRAGFLKALRGIKRTHAGGLFQPMDLTQFPYVTSQRVRVLRPLMGKATWQEAAPYAEPKSLAAAPPKP